MVSTTKKMTGLAKLVLPVKKFQAAIRRRRAESQNAISRRAEPESSSSLGRDNVKLTTASPWNLPVEIQVTIFAYCGIANLLPLRLVCKAFFELLVVHEQSIVRQYLRQRRHGTLPSPIDSDRTYTRNPEDDVVLLSDLFPPSKSANGGHLYTFKYLHGLRRRQKLNVRLCYYLADRVMDRFVQSEPAFIRSSFPSRSERNVLLRRGKSTISFNLTPLMYYAVYFLESYTSARREHTNMLLREFEVGRLPVPIPREMRQSMYLDLQTRILRSPPFSNTSTLIATHHCMQLLVSYIRYTMSLEGEFDDSWINSLLTLSPFARIVEFFSAEIGDGGNQRMQRKDFMYNFHHDMQMHEREDMNSVVFARPPDDQSHSSLRDIWFDAARAELGLRQAASHDAENIWVWNGIPILIGCPDCEFMEGWLA